MYHKNFDPLKSFLNVKLHIFMSTKKKNKHLRFLCFEVIFAPCTITHSYMTGAKYVFVLWVFVMNFLNNFLDWKINNLSFTSGVNGKVLFRLCCVRYKDWMTWIYMYHTRSIKWFIAKNTNIFRSTKIHKFIIYVFLWLQSTSLY